MEFVPSSASSFRTGTPTPSSASNGTSVLSIVDLPMNAEEGSVGFSALTRSRSSHHTWISSNTQDIMSPDKPGESPPGNHRQHRSMYDKPSRSMVAAFSKTSQEKRPGTASSSSSRLADSIERIWRSKSYSYTDSRSSKGARSSVYDPELGVRILLCKFFPISLNFCKGRPRLFPSRDYEQQGGVRALQIIGTEQVNSKATGDGEEHKLDVLG